MAQSVLHGDVQKEGAAVRTDQEARLWTAQETADYYGVPLRTVYAWSHMGKGPRGYRVGKYLRFKPAECTAWLEAQPGPNRAP